jgi:hypothetical protein
LYGYAIYVSVGGATTCAGAAAGLLKVCVKGVAQAPHSSPINILISGRFIYHPMKK